MPTRPSLTPVGDGRSMRALILATVIASAASAQTPARKTYANPIDIDYRYNWE